MFDEELEEVFGYVSCQGYGDVDDFTSFEGWEVTEKFHGAWAVE